MPSHTEKGIDLPPAIEKASREEGKIPSPSSGVVAVGGHEKGEKEKQGAVKGHEKGEDKKQGPPLV